MNDHFRWSSKINHQNKKIPLTAATVFLILTGIN